MDSSPSAKSVLLLMAAAAAWISFFLVADASAGAVACIRRERDALLALKQGINDTDDELRSWQRGSQDCCRWAGITCSNMTGRVIGLDLSRRFSLVGQISPSLLSLEHLQYLNLKSTSLCGHGGRIPEFLGSLNNLRHLDLSYMSFSGVLPPQLGNLSKLEYLDLSNMEMDVIDISWLSRLPRLMYLDISYTNLSSIAAWPPVVNMIPSLKDLRLSYCSLSSTNQSLTHLNLTNLQHLDLSRNYFAHPIASSWFWNVTSIEYLDLSDTSLHGPFPNALGKMTFLRQLSFFGIGNTATMTVDLKNLCDLEIIWLDGSLSSGNVTEFLKKLPRRCPSNRLQELKLSSNNMVGMLPNRMDYLTNLSSLDLSYNNITGAIPPWLENCTSLSYLSLSSNSLTGPIPVGIGRCTLLDILDLSYNNITGAIPLGIGNFTTLRYLVLSHNLLSGHVPSKIGMLGDLIDLDLSNNNLDGLFTREHMVSLKNLRHMDLSHNSFSGPLPIETRAQFLKELTLSSNYFSGHIPESICQLRNLLVLDLSDNFLEGELPHCSHKPNLVFLLLSNNGFSGKFPSSLRNYSSLAFMDLSWNNLYGTLPFWIEELVNLRFLQLSHNLLYGDIPVTITNLQHLHQLSLAGNNISGAIPESLSNLTSMAQKDPQNSEDYMSAWYNNNVGTFRQVWHVVMKRQELKYGAGIFDVVGIDLSLNHLIGEIPEMITSLGGLLNLNLSWNHLSGKIPGKIGAMKSVESLDLSRNNLYGEIPASLSELTFLSSLDLSYNNLTGIIPRGSQLDTIYIENPAIYTGNIGLCGPPLERNCSGNNSLEHVNQPRRDNVYEAKMFFYFGLGSGYVAGLWVVFCAMLFRKAWRVAYFRLFDKLYDKAYVFAVLTWGRINGKASTS
uniref:Cf2/Cf5 disease resistance protein homolog n=1 Tax=Hordeum vulgare TaxID=4513 RepID=Q9SWE6_HORVU|nr:Cf2/Cf5 disease resistance protein homolog [Hordeum vulgare subsp. vulgare]